ncbi:MAG TPA: GAF domain-containing protein [Thermomicrobiaceae bacterium]|nr:GAF domain-containing protein [Thermomicrobiaceae bacterium]
MPELGHLTIDNNEPGRDQLAAVHGRSRQALADLLSQASAATPSESGTLLAAATYGEMAAVENQSIEEAFQALIESSGGTSLSSDPKVLGAVVRGFMDYTVKLRGLVRRGGTGPLSSHVARLAALHRINQAATNLDLETMLKTVVEVVKQTTGTDSCSIFLYEPTSATLVLRATIGLNPEAVGRVRLALTSGITGLAALTNRLLAVPDARSHPAYLDYPMVGDHRYTSQVSVPLALSGQNRLVGVLNILSIARREFDPDELAFLETAAGEIAISIDNARLYSETDAQLRTRLAQLGTLQQMSRMVASTLDSSEVLRLISRHTVDLVRAEAAEIYGGRVPAAERLDLLARYSGGEDEGSSELEPSVIALVEEVMRSGVATWRQLEATGRYVYAVPMLTARRAAGAICVYLSEPPAEAYEVRGLLNAFSDSAAIALENAELYDEALRGYARASTLLQEMHHRVRNNLQTVAALLSMQARHAAHEAWTAPLQEAVARIRSIAIIHDLLSSGDFRDTTVEAIARHVAEEVNTTMARPGRSIDFRIEPATVRIPSRQATVLALLINEFLTNAVTHGMRDRHRGEVVIRAGTEDRRVTVVVEDDGAGVAQDFDIGASSGLGLQIAATLVSADLHGSLSISRCSAAGGTAVRICFPLVEAGPDDIGGDTPPS